MYVYVNEHASSLDYINDQLLWKQEGMIYGDWLENENGYVSMTTQFTLGEVLINKFFWSCHGKKSRRFYLFSVCVSIEIEEERVSVFAHGDCPDWR